MLSNWVKGAGHLLRSRTTRMRHRRRLAMLALVLGVFGTNSATAALPVLTFGQLTACPVDNLALRNQPAAGAALPESIRAVIGREVRITGYMLPLVTENGRAHQLLLMRNTMACCYGQSPAANEYLVVKTLPPGLPVTMDVPVTVRGTLRVDPVSMGGALVEYFHLDNAAPAER